jgi:hypothetical protein
MPYTCSYCGELREANSSLCQNCSSSKYSYTASNLPNSFMQSEYYRMAQWGMDGCDTLHSEECICPHCAKIIDSTDICADTEWTCSHCAGRLRVDVDLTTTYTTRKVE